MFKAWIFDEEVLLFAAEQRPQSVVVHENEFCDRRWAVTVVCGFDEKEAFAIEFGMAADEHVGTDIKGDVRPRVSPFVDVPEEDEGRDYGAPPSGEIGN